MKYSQNPNEPQPPLIFMKVFGESAVLTLGNLGIMPLSKEFDDINVPISTKSFPI
jgi:hypothetical protein